MIAIGNINASKVYLGNEEISKIYLGSTQIWGGATPVLPYDAQVEYIQSTGTQWIDTGIVFSSGNEEVNIKFEFTEISTSDNNILFGAYNVSGSTSKRLFTFVGSDGKWKTSYGNVISSNVAASANTEYTVRLYFRNGRQDLTVNGTDIINATQTSSNIPTTVSQAIFCSNYTNGITSPSKMKLKSYDMSLNGVKVRDYIPVRVGQVGYLYDTVSGELFGDVSGNGFNIGNDVTT